MAVEGTLEITISNQEVSVAPYGEIVITISGQSTSPQPPVIPDIIKAKYKLFIGNERADF